MTTKTELRTQIAEILYPVYNYGWPGTGMPGTQEQKSPSVLTDDILTLLEDTVREAELNYAIGILDNVEMLYKEHNYDALHLYNACYRQNRHLKLRLVELKEQGR